MKTTYINLLNRLLVRILLIPYRLFSFLFLRKRMITIVTGADSTHFRSLLQLINSLQVIEKGNFRITVYDLGCTDSEINIFKSLHPDIILKKFDYDQYPPHFNIKIDCGNYAWKPAIIHHEYNLLPAGAFFLWLDAGCFIRKPLYLIRSAIYLYGLYCPDSGTKIKDLTHRFTIEEMNLDNRGQLKMLAATIIGLRSGKNKNDVLIDSWFKAAKDKDIIAPLGSSKANHRYDQSLLSLLYYEIYNVTKGPLASHKWLEVVPHRDIG